MVTAYLLWPNLIIILYNHSNFYQLVNLRLPNCNFPVLNARMLNNAYIVNVLFKKTSKYFVIFKSIIRFT